MAVTLAAGDDVIDAAVDEGVIVIRELGFRFVKGQALEYADVAFAKGRRSVYPQVQ